MISVRMHLTGVQELAATLNKLPVAVKKATLYKVLKKAAEPMRERMSQMCPRSSQKRPVKQHVRRQGEGFLTAAATQHMADNIVISAATRIGSTAGGRWKVSDDFTAAVAVGPAKDFYYGIFQEYGTVRHGAQAFARPAFDATEHIAFNIIKAELWKLISAQAQGMKIGPTTASQIDDQTSAVSPGAGGMSSSGFGRYSGDLD